MKRYLCWLCAVLALAGRNFALADDRNLLIDGFGAVRLKMPEAELVQSAHKETSSQDATLYRDRSTAFLAGSEFAVSHAAFDRQVTVVDLQSEVTDISSEACFQRFADLARLASATLGPFDDDPERLEEKDWTVLRHIKIFGDWSTVIGAVHSTEIPAEKKYNVCSLYITYAIGPFRDEFD